MANISVKINSSIIYLFKKKNPIHSFSVLNYYFYFKSNFSPLLGHTYCLECHSASEAMSFQLFYFMIDFAELSDPVFPSVCFTICHFQILHCQQVNYGFGTDVGIKHVFSKQQSHEIKKVLLHEAVTVTVIGF